MHHLGLSAPQKWAKMFHVKQLPNFNPDFGMFHVKHWVLKYIKEAALEGRFFRLIYRYIYILKPKNEKVEA